MEEPQQEVGDGRELKGGLPSGVWFLVAFVAFAQNLDLLVSLVVKEHSGHDGEVDQDKGSSEYEAALADEAPWRMADPKEDGLLRVRQHLLSREQRTYIVLDLSIVCWKGSFFWRDERRRRRGLVGSGRHWSTEPLGARIRRMTG